MLKNIKAMCAKVGCSINELERACGIGTNSIYRWDDNKPAIDKVQRVAQHLGCTIDDLLRKEAE